MTDKCREEFEAWVCFTRAGVLFFHPGVRGNFELDSDGKYVNEIVELLFEVWQARQKEIDALVSALVATILTIKQESNGNNHEMEVALSDIEDICEKALTKHRKSDYRICSKITLLSTPEFREAAIAKVGEENVIQRFNTFE